MVQTTSITFKNEKTKKVPPKKSYLISSTKCEALNNMKKTKIFLVKIDTKAFQLTVVGVVGSYHFLPISDGFKKEGVNGS